eukprot:14898243-Alexandrium_andersonii.AAC.2
MEKRALSASSGSERFKRVSGAPRGPRPEKRLRRHGAGDAFQGRPGWTQPPRIGSAGSRRERA